MFCTPRSYLSRTDLSVTLKPVRCKTWPCEWCGDVNRRVTIAKTVAGNPNTCLTLTTNPKKHSDPDTAATSLGRAFKKLIRQIRKHYPHAEIAYFKIYEQTKNGWPHLHVALRAPYIPQHWISEFMDREIGAPIVDIRAIRGARQAARYMAKYLAKEPHRFEGCNRVSHSRNWLDPEKGATGWTTHQKAEVMQLYYKTVDYVAIDMLGYGFSLEPIRDGYYVHSPRGPDIYERLQPALQAEQRQRPLYALAGR